jgi:selenocysteine-specific elongation factor
LTVGDTVQLMPAGVPLRVRALQVLNQPAETAPAGQRCAVNLSGTDLKRAAPARGDWLTAADAPPATDRLDVLLQWLPGVAPPRPGPRAQWLLHLGAATRTVRWVPLDDAAPGAASFARLLPDAPVVAAWGDRFILRDAAANRTLAGGQVVDAFGPLRGKAQPQRLDQLHALALPDAGASLQALLDTSPAGVDLILFARNRGLRDDEAAALEGAAGLRRLPMGRGQRLGLAAARWAAWQRRLLQVVDGWHAAQPDSLGPDMAALRAALGTIDGAPGLLRAGLPALAADGQLQRDGLVWRRPGHRPALSATDAELLARVTALLAPAGLRPPIVIELARLLAMPLPALLDGLARLVARGLLVRVAPNRCYLPAGAAQLEAEARALAAVSADGVIDAAAYRDRTGIGRNLTVQVLEFLDRSGATRFDGRHHHLRD